MKPEIKAALAGAFLAVFMAGCGLWNRTITKYTGDLTYKCSKHGIEYVQSDSGLAVSYHLVVSDDTRPGHGFRFEPVRCEP